VAGKYKVRGLDIGFEISTYDHHSTLIIDPVLLSATYLGGANFDQSNGVAVDAAGFIYIVGETWSIDFPSGVSAHKTSNANSDAFVSKLDPTGTVVLYTVFLRREQQGCSHVNRARCAGRYLYCWLHRIRPNLPTTSGALRRVPAGLEDAFVARLSSSTGALLYSTYLGGQGSDFATAVTTDPAGYVYVAGNTSSVDFPVSSTALQLAFKGGYSDGFVVKLNPQLAVLDFATYFGGSEVDTVAAVAIGGNGAVYITGSTMSPDLPLQGRYSGNGDAFVAGLDSSGSHLVLSTYLGGSGADNGTAIGIDGGNILIAGNTASWDLPTTSNSFQPAWRSSYEGFVARISGGSVTSCTYLGGVGSDSVAAMVVDSAGNVDLAGYTFSTDFPTSGELHGFSGRQDAFVATLDRNLARLLWSTYLGGAGDDAATSLALGPQGALYVVGMTTSTDFLSKAGIAKRLQARTDADGFLVRVSGPDNPSPPAAVSLTPPSGAGYTQTFTFSFPIPAAPLRSLPWRFASVVPTGRIAQCTSTSSRQRFKC
jgi:hypothetical protein